MVPPVQTVLRLVRVPLYGAQSAQVTGRETRKRPSGVGFYEPVREGGHDTNLAESRKEPGTAQMDGDVSLE
jgi:hypothetical protein